MKNTLLALALFALTPFYVAAQEKKASFDVADEGKIIISASGSFGYRPEKIDGGYEGAFSKHIKKLKYGYSYQANAYHMFNYRAGLGIEFNTFKSSDTMPGTYDVTALNGETGNSKVSDDITISFYGLGFIFNIFEESRQKLYFNASFGYLHYKNETFVIDNYKITGGGLGTSLGISYQYLIFEDFSVGPRLNFSGTSIRRFTYKGPDGYSEKLKLNKDDAEKFLRLDVGVQLMYRF